MKANEVLSKVCELLSDRKHWTKGTFARLGNNWESNVQEPKACKFCLEGALLRVTGAKWASTLEGENFAALEAIQDAVVDRGYYDIYEFNDHPNTKHSDILEVIGDAERRVASGS